MPSTTAFSLKPAATEAACPHAGLRADVAATTVLRQLRATDGLAMNGQQLRIILDPQDAGCRVARVNGSNSFMGVDDGETTNKFDILESKELNIVSDRRFKMNVNYLHDISGSNYLVKVLHAMRVYRYMLKGTQTTQLGVMADEYYEAVSSILGEKTAGQQQYQTVNYNHLLMLLLANTQRLECRISDLEALHSDRGMEHPTHCATDIITPDVVTGDGEIQALEALEVLGAAGVPTET